MKCFLLNGIQVIIGKRKKKRWWWGVSVVACFDHEVERKAQLEPGP